MGFGSLLSEYDQRKLPITWHPQSPIQRSTTYEVGGPKCIQPSTRDDVCDILIRSTRDDAAPIPNQRYTATVDGLGWPVVGVGVVVAFPLVL